MKNDIALTAEGGSYSLLQDLYSEKINKFKKTGIEARTGKKVHYNTSGQSFWVTLEA